MSRGAVPGPLRQRCSCSAPARQRTRLRLRGLRAAVADEGAGAWCARAALLVADALLGPARGKLLFGKKLRLQPDHLYNWGRVKTWKRRWFILTDNCLYYFEYTTDKEPRGIIPLENLSIREVEDPRKPNCFELYNPSHKGQVIKACKTEADGRVVEGNHVVYRISAPTPEEKEEWIKSIKASISRDPFYDMLATRKRRIANKK
ncbi:hypothetical protein AV530_000753 [Patagioenas fasciata monilis]|uniref:PH domain-containing protein n=1 Tax=Patagioenas fasciata monilis TaxID=372326 RepID=A0A1V4KTR1_PATFA|nr:hypothetical protein AV530_000753 [Patagioenas fasciata monilis]